MFEQLLKVILKFFFILLHERIAISLIFDWLIIEQLNGFEQALKHFINYFQKFKAKMTAPTISLQSSQSMNNIMGSTGTFVQYELYADMYSFENWKDWVTDSINSPTATEKENATKYSNYVLKFKCQLAQQQNSCGLKHPTHGGFLINSDAADGSIAATTSKSSVVSNTYVMKKADLNTWIDSPSNLVTTDSSYVANTSIADPYFQFFYCGGSRDHTYTCYKYQPVTGSDGDPRFDTNVSGA